MTVSNIKKTVWIFNQYAIKPVFPGGTRHYDIGTELVKRGFNVHIFAGGFHYLLLKDVILSSNEKRKIEETDGITFHWLQVIPYKKNDIFRFISMLGFYLSLIRESRHFRKDKNNSLPDIIIGSSVHLLNVLAAYRVSKACKARFLMEVRDLWPHTMVANGQMSSLHPAVIFFGILERFLYKRSEKIISLLENANMYIGKYTNTDKIHVIPNSFNRDNLEQLNNNLTISINYNPDLLTIMFAGSINTIDNLSILVKAFEVVKNKIPNTRLIIIGDGMDKVNIESYINKKKIKDILILSSVPKNQILKYLNCADLLWAGTPDSDLYQYGISFNKFYDYMAVKKPIILSSSQHINMLHDAKCTIFAMANDIDDLSKKIIDFSLLDKSEKKELGINGYNYLMNNFTTEIITTRLVNEVFNK